MIAGTERTETDPSGNPVLAVEELHVEVEGHEILRGVDLVLGEGELHALDGTERVGKVDPRQHPRRQPRLPGHERPDPSSR